jgi:sugar/nucleoside kinase (ribokinase family)
MKKVVGLGACVLDTLITCENYPKEDTKQKAESIFLSGGGPVGNALVVMSKLGVKTEVLGAFADDNAGKYLLDDFKKYGVGVENATVVRGSSSFTSYIILSKSGKTRTCTFDRGSVPDAKENVCFGAIENADVLHLDGNYLQSALAAAKYAKEKGVKVSLDAGGLYEGIENLLPFVDILIPSAEFALGFTGEKDIPSAMHTLFKRFQPEILVVTDGSNGGYYYENGQVLHYDSVQVQAVDTNGAGDTFHGAFVAAYCEGQTLKDCCVFASKVAAYKCMHTGARTYELSKEIADKL